MTRYLVLGGGASGLASAYYLSRAAKSAKVILVEGSNRVGGWLESSYADTGAIFDHGPRSLRATGVPGKNTLLLADELNLAPDVLYVNARHPASKNRFIFVNNQIHPLPNSLLGFMKQQTPFSKSLLRQCWKEPLTKRQYCDDDTVFNFFSRRFGNEVASYLIDPLCRGIFAGDCQQLSIKACFGSLFEWEQKYGSIVLGAVRQKRGGGPALTSPLIGRAAREDWRLWTLRGGLQQLADELKNQLLSSPNVELSLDEPCTKIEAVDGAFQVHTTKRDLYVDHIFACLPAHELASVVRGPLTSMTKQLQAIHSADVAVVNLEYPGPPSQLLPFQGFGHLIPSSEPSKLLGVVYESCVFPEHDRQDKPSTRLTCMMGGAWFRDLFGDASSVDAAAFEELAVQGVRDQLGIKEPPSYCQVKLQLKCIPQYAIGHTELVKELERQIETNKLPLSLLGASYKGVSVNDCIYNAKLEVERILAKTNNLQHGAQ